MPVPVTLPSAFCCNATENASAGVPVVVVNVATQVPVMVGCAVGVGVTVTPLGVVGVVELTFPPQAASISIKMSSQAEASFTSTSSYAGTSRNDLSDEFLVPGGRH